MLTLKKPFLSKLATGAASLVTLCQFGYGQDTVPDRIYAEKIREQQVTTSQGFTPLGNRSDANRFGDDGSAAVVDLSGLVLWKTSNGVVRPLSNSAKARPLFVTNSECVLWTNALEPSSALALPLQVTYYRLESSTGNVQSKVITLDGTSIVDTPQITNPTFPFGIVTVNKTLGGGTAQSNFDGSSFYYRMTWDGGAQLLGKSGDAAVIDYKLVGSGNDGSYILLLLNNDAVTAATSIGVSAPWYNSEGRIVDLAAGLGIGLEYPNGVAFDALPRRNIFTSNTSAVVATQVTAAPISWRHDYWVRTANNDTINRTSSLRANVPLPVTNQPPVGKPTYLYEFNNTTTITQSLLLNGVYVNPVTFVLPATVSLDPASAAVIAINSSEANLPDQTETLTGTAVLRGLRVVATNRNAYLWLHPGIPGFNFDPAPFAALSNTTNDIVTELTQQQTVPATFAASGGNFSFVGHSVTANPEGYPLLVSLNQLVYWENAFASNTDDGSRPLVRLRQYNNSAAGITVRFGDTTYTGIRRAPIVNLLPFTSPFAEPQPIPGTSVIIPAAFNTEARNWRLSTYLKGASNNSFSAYEFRLSTSDTADVDSDGIVSILEESPYIIIPGNFTYAEALADAPLHGGVVADVTTVPADLAVAITGIRYQLNNESSKFGSRVNIPSTGIWVAAAAGPVAQRIQPSLAIAAGGSLSTLRGGYLLKLPSTNRFEPDIDGDNLVDGAEIDKTFTSPTAANFSVVPAAPVVNLNDPLLVGNYSGVVYGPLGQELAVTDLSVARGGSFTGKIVGSFGNIPIRGALNSQGAATGINARLGASTTIASLQMVFSAGAWSVEGNLTGLDSFNSLPVYWPRTSRPVSFRLFRRVITTSRAGNYAFTIPSSGSVGMPAGDGYGTLTISSNGAVTLSGRLANNATISWQGGLLANNRIAMASVGIWAPKTSFVGNLFLRSNAKFNLLTPTKEESDLDGVLGTSVAATSTSAGFDLLTPVYGSSIRPVGFAQLPAFTDFNSSANNVLLNFEAGALSSKSFIATWNSTGRITAPTTQTLPNLNASYNNRSGLVSGSLVYGDPNRGYARTNANLYAVMLQKSGQIRGFYSSGSLLGKFTVSPNYGGNPAPTTTISPSFAVYNAAGGSFVVNVSTSERWSVVVPDTLGWVVVDTFSGTGDGSLTVSVLPNFGNTNREAAIKIAGRTLVIRQSYNNGTVIPLVSIAPLARQVGRAGGSYPVTVSSNGEFTAAMVNGQNFDSNVAWITVAPVVVSGVVTSATVTVAANTSGFQREADIVIAGITHRVIQGAGN